MNSLMNSYVKVIKEFLYGVNLSNGQCFVNVDNIKATFTCKFNYLANDKL